MELLISAGQVLTGPAGERITGGAVLVDQDTIVAVGRRDDIEPHASRDVTRLHRPDATVLPGLINSHVHLAFDAGPDPVTTLQGTDDTGLLLGMAGRARQLLDGGVTTARDLGDRGGLAVRLRDAVAAGTLPGPRLLAATAPLTAPAGHCWFFGGEVDGEQAIREQVRRNARGGADVIKVMVSGGQMTPSGANMWESQFSTEELRAAVEEARELGLPVAAHAHGTAGIISAVTAGVNTIEHCSWLRDGQFDAREDIAAQMAEKGISVCPTMTPNWRGFRAMLGEERAEQFFGQVRWMDKLGVRLAAGTDAGVPRSVFDDFVSSFGMYDYLGFPNDRIIELATVGAAGALGLGGDTGRLEAGFSADLLVVDGDPLTDLDTLRDIEIVLTRGRPHVPAQRGIQRCRA